MMTGWKERGKGRTVVKKERGRERVWKEGIEKGEDKRERKEGTKRGYGKSGCKGRMERGDVKRGCKEGM